MSGDFERRWPNLDVRAGVIAFRRTPEGDIEFMLVRRPDQIFWSVPKGRPMRGRALHEAASIEAHEEAGLSGKVGPEALGSCRHAKAPTKAGVPPQIVEVVLFPMEVHEVSLRWPEMAFRERRWFRNDQAIGSVAPGQLREILSAFTSSRVLEAQ